VIARLAKGRREGYSLEGVHDYLKRQQDFAASQGFTIWVVETTIARAMLNQAAGKQGEALGNLEAGLKDAANTGLFRIFVDEGEPVQALLKALKPRLTDQSLIAYANRLLDGFSSEPAKHEAADKHEATLSERELEVLRYLAAGLSYKEIGQQLYLSLNTIQFHVKNIYSKLLVNKRAHAIEKAREMNLI
jgi:LuxR family maltose regulon positive regulatory protein